MPPEDRETFDTAASRLFDTVVLSRRDGSDFPRVLSDGLAAALRLLEAEPALAETLLARTPSPELLDRCSYWQQAFAELLHQVAREAGCRQAPFFLEPHLIAAAAWMIGRRPRLAPAETHASLLECLLAYYVEPEELQAAVLACVDPAQ